MMNRRLHKIFICLITLIVLSTLLSGCSDESNYANTEQNAVSYVENEDFQSFLSAQSAFAKVENGYYFFKNMHLYYFDTQNNEAYIVCNKPTCEHNNDSCTAFFSIFNYYPFQLSYCGNALYILGWETDSKRVQHNYIYQVSLETYKRKKVAYLFDGTGMGSVTFIIHRGYVYFLKGNGNDLKENTSYLYRTKIGNINENEEAETIYEFSGIGASIIDLKASGNNIVVLNASYGDTKGNNYSTSYNLIDIHSLESRKIVGNEAYSLFVNEEYAYYEKGENLVNCINLNTNEEEFFCNIKGPCYISADSNYIYFDNLQAIYIDKTDEHDRKIFVYDKSGNYITEITPKNPKDDCYFGGDDVMIFKEVVAGESFETDGAKGFYVLDKSTLTSDKKEFIDMV